MRIRRKSSSCLNCGFTLDKVYNYCPNCGQDNNNNNVTFGTLVGDFFSTYFSFDSRFAHSFIPFFIQPGRLTTEYINGKRAHFAHPLRLYLIISLFYFFVFSLVGKESIKDDNNSNSVVSVNSDDEWDDVEEIDEQTKEKISKALSKNKLRRINSDLDGTTLDNLKESMAENLSKRDKIRLLRDLDSAALRLLELDTLLQDSLVLMDVAAARRYADSVRARLDSIKQIKAKQPIQDSITKDTLSNRQSTAKKAVSNNEKTDSDDSDEFILNRIDFDIINKYKDDKNVTDEGLYDSLQIDNLSAFEERLTRQTIRVMRSDEEQLADLILKNLPLMMLLLIPIFALILKLMYARRKHLYIKHLIHGFHLHSFAYLFYGVCLLLILYATEDEDWQSLIGFIGFIIVSTYAYISFLRVYKQHWFKTLIKFNLVGIIYNFFIFTFFVAEMLISMFFY